MASQSTESTNPRNFQIDPENYADDWRSRYGGYDQGRTSRKPLTNSQALGLLPELIRSPSQGEPNWLHPGVKSWNESTFNFAGLTFLGCGMIGFLQGGIKGYRTTSSHKSKLPRKLIVNSIMNWGVRNGIAGSNAGAAIIVTSYAVAYLSEQLRRTADAYNFIPAWVAIGGIVGGQRLGKYDLGLKGVISGLVAGLLVGITAAGAQQYRTETDVLPELQNLLGTKMFGREDTRFIDDYVPPPSNDIYEIQDETEQILEDD